MKYFIPLLMNFLFFYNGGEILYAQNRKIDSLMNEFKKAGQAPYVSYQKDTIRIKIYWEIAGMYLSEKPDTVLYYYHKALSLAELCIENIGIVHVYQGSY